MITFKKFLSEGRLDRYMTMIRTFPGFSHGDKDVNAIWVKSLKEIIGMLKREDAIMWWLRHAKAKAIVDDKNKDHENAAEYAKWLKDFKKSFGYTDDKEFNHPKMTALKLSHYLSLPIPEIENVRFKDQKLADMFNKFAEIEKKWISDDGNQYFDVTDDLQSGDLKQFIEFSDGYAWFYFENESCNREAEAMGHCGNRHTSNTNERIMSLRKVKKVGKRTFVRPSLTFIYDYKKKTLGEMKGRANEKPKAEYHDKIIALLLNKTYPIDAVIGGGYAPEKNFSLNDLTDSQLKHLLGSRPELETLDVAIRLNDGKIDEHIIDKYVSDYKHSINIGHDGEYVKIESGKSIRALMDDLAQHANGKLEDLFSLLAVDDFKDEGFRMRQVFDDLAHASIMRLPEKYKDWESLKYLNGFIRDWKKKFPIYLANLLAKNPVKDDYESKYTVNIEGPSIYITIEAKDLATFIRNKSLGSIIDIMNVDDIDRTITANIEYFEDDSLIFSEKDANR